VLVCVFVKFSPQLISNDIDETERSLREQRPNVANAKDLVSMMEMTRDSRRSWVTKNNPSITEILRRYPRLQDIPDTVSDFFCKLDTYRVR
jgi:hypothetical protein